MIEIPLNNTSYWIDPAKCKIKAELVDHGIGPYEFWGARGTDVRMELEVEVEIPIAYDENENEITDPKTLCWLEEKIQENPEPWAEYAKKDFEENFAY